MHQPTALLFLLPTLTLAVAQYGGGSGSSTTSGSTAATTTGSSSSATHTIQVGANGFVFTPDSVDAAIGTTLEFHFTGSSLHDVVSSSFSGPCNEDGALYSGYPKTDEVFQVMVNSTDPMWLYCSTPGHCQGGMAMVVNQASSGAKTLAAYKSAAQGTSSSNAPANVAGGTVVAVSALSAGGSSSSSAGSSMPSSTTSASTSSSSAASSSSGALVTSTASLANVVLAGLLGVSALVWLF